MPNQGNTIVDGCNLSEIIDDARNYFSGCHDYKIYEFFKCQLDRLNLPAIQYEIAVQKITEILEI